MLPASNYITQERKVIITYSLSICEAAYKHKEKNKNQHTFPCLNIAKQIFKAINSSHQCFEITCCLIIEIFNTTKIQTLLTINYFTPDPDWQWYIIKDKIIISLSASSPLPHTFNHHMPSALFSKATFQMKQSQVFTLAQCEIPRNV